jgi:hypothetical protein
MRRLARLALLALLLPPLPAATAGCSGASGGTPAGASGNGDALVGGFEISLLTDLPPPAATITGVVKAGPRLAEVIWERAASDGTCVLLEPRIPFCSPACGSGAVCVEDGVCKPSPANVGVGTVTVSGIKTAAGDTEVPLSATGASSYNSLATTLAFPPFDEGAELAVTATGGASAAFSVHAKGIAPLVVPEGTLPLERDKPLPLGWAPKEDVSDATIHVHVDLSHHGGTKGKLECDVPDVGSFTIPALLVTQLVNLGVSGFPAVQLTRSSVGVTVTPLGKIQLAATHSVQRLLTVPGHLSCAADDQCPTGQSCQPDLQCQ